MSDERGGRYFREARFFLAGDKVAAQSHIGEARMLMGYMRDQLALGGPAIQVQYTSLQDGTQIKATMMNGQYQAQIFTPSRALEIGGDVYEVWVRPDWSEVLFTDAGPYAEGATRDWLVADASPCSATTTREVPKLYSNRIWHAPNKAIYCIVGGRDRDKYAGTAGSVVSRDGELVYSGTAIVGAAEFRSQLVVITHAVTTNALTTPYRDQVVFTVSVGGVVKLVTPTIDAYVDGGYARELDQIGFSQQIFAFNADGSEASCVLGNAHRIVFSLSSNAGIVAVSYAIVAIVGADYTYTPSGGAIYGQTNTCTGSLPGTLVRTWHTYSTSLPNKAFTLALFCDYGPTSNEVVYLFLDYMDAVTNASGSSDVRTTISSVCVDTYQQYDLTESGTGVSDESLRCTLRFSTGETLYTWAVGQWSESASTIPGTSTGMHTQATAAADVIVIAVDVRHKFICLYNPLRTTYVSSTVTTHTVVPVGSQMRMQVYRTDTNTSFLGLAKYNAGFSDNPTQLEKVIVGDPLGTTTIDGPYLVDSWTQYTTVPCSSSASCSLPQDNYTEHTDTTTFGVPTRTDSIKRPTVISYADGPTPDATYSGAVVIPSARLFNKALVFLQFPNAPAEAYAICATGGVSNVTAQFTDSALLNDFPITRHFGVIHKTNTGPK